MKSTQTFIHEHPQSFWVLVLGLPPPGMQKHTKAKFWAVSKHPVLSSQAGLIPGSGCQGFPPRKHGPGLPWHLPELLPHARATSLQPHLGCVAGALGSLGKSRPRAGCLTRLCPTPCAPTVLLRGAASCSACPPGARRGIFALVPQLPCVPPRGHGVPAASPLARLLSCAAWGNHTLFPE